MGPHYMGRKWVLIDPITVVCYSRNTGLMLDVDLALMLRRGAHRPTSVLERGAHKLALKLKREAIQTCIFMLKRDCEVRVSKSSTTISFSAKRDHNVVLLSSGLFRHCTIESGELSISLASVLLNRLQK